MQHKTNKELLPWSVKSSFKGEIKDKEVDNEGQYIVALYIRGEIRPSEHAKSHYCERDAICEAARLCRKHNEQFVVLKAVRKLKPVVQVLSTQI